MKIYLIVGAIFLLIVFGVMMPDMKKQDNVSVSAVVWVRRETSAFIAKVNDLKQALALIGSNKDSLEPARDALVNCRLQYKRLAFFVEYFFPEQALAWNGPPVMEAEPGEELKDASGLQLVEQILLGDEPSSHLQEMTAQADMLVRSAENITPLLGDFKINNSEILESFHLELIRIMTLYITGFDAPQLKTGIRESHTALATIDTLLISTSEDRVSMDSLRFYLSKGEKYLKENDDFDSFDRLYFITEFAQPIEKYLNAIIRQSKHAGISSSALNDSSDNLFVPGALNIKAFPHSQENSNEEQLAKLGEKLFFDPALSGNHTRSCATCHSPANFFTDGLPRNKDFDGNAELPRNTPSLFYAAYQHSQFWDGRVETLEDQVTAVLSSKSEMNSAEETLVKRLQDDPRYITASKKIWPGDSCLSYNHVRAALAAYVRTLSPFRSPFDRYMKGDITAMSVSQKKGFNLFMGKAQCGTCHFAPVFNGLLPPYYNVSEFEVLGTLSNDIFEDPKTDNDPGRYAVQPGPTTKGAFKTPTVRNAAMTAPYMHNGRFSTMEKVIDFYDKGGGSGLGLNIPDQTLSSTTLDLTSQEKQDLISFIEALTDK